MKLTLKHLNDAFTLVVLFLATGAFQSFIVKSETSTALTAGSRSMEAIWAAVYIVVALRVFQNYRQIWEMICANNFLLLLVVFAIFSAKWSVAPDLTLRRGIALFVTTLFGMDFAVRYSIREQLRLLAIVLGIVVVSGVFMQVLFPGLVPVVRPLNPGAWIGAFGQKNVFGRMVALTTILMLVLLRRSLSSLWKGAFIVLAGLALTIVAKSMTALLVLIALLLFLAFSGLLTWRWKFAFVARFLLAVIAVPLVYAVAISWDYLLALLGRDVTLTGRAELWTFSIANISEHPLLGHGYNAFWNVAREALWFNIQMNWNVPHAHNAFLELALELGVIGLALFLGSYFISLRRAFTYMRTNPEREAIWPIIYLLFVFLYSFTEGQIATPNSMLWILYVAATCAVTQLVPVRVVSPASDFMAEEAIGVV